MPPVLSTAPNAAIPAFRKKPACDVSGAKKHAAGTVIIAPDGSILLLRRSKLEKNFGGHWALPGGGVDAGETPEEGAAREMREEIGREIGGPRKLLDRRRTPTGMIFHTFIQPTPEKFAPKLNDEHSGYDWADLDSLPSPLHPAVESTLRERIGVAEDMEPEDWEGLRSGLMKWIAEEEQEAEHGGSADGKLSHAEVRYTAMAKDQAERCGVCRHFASGHCELVADPISPKGWCMKFDKRRAAASDAKREAEHTAVIEYDGDFDLAELFRPLHWLGAVGASREVHVCPEDDETRRELEKKGYRTRLGWDGDGADKIRSVKIDGKDVSLEPRKMAATDSAMKLALDKSVRTFDEDGRMFVAVTNISKATVNPYRGEEIPGWEDLGLERDKVYKLLRDPEELEKAAPTFNGIQLLKRHVPVDADDHQMWDIVGCTGTSAVFEKPYLKNALSVWTSEAIAYIESEDRRELSCGYHYDLDLTPGEYEGEKYDGVMRNIRGNHVALVEEGRAGHDVLVHDSLEEMQWAVLENALGSFLFGRGA